MLACGSTPPQQHQAAEPIAIAPPADTQSPGPEPAATSTPAPTATETTAPPVTESNAAEKELHPANAQSGLKTALPGPHLGAPCDRADTAHCGRSGRIAVQRNDNQSMAMRPDMPCTLSAVSTEKTGYVLRACVAEGQVYASGECIMCRMMGAGWSVIGEIDAMTIAQRSDLQKRLGLPASPTLQFEAAWAAAIAKAAKRVKP